MIMKIFRTTDDLAISWTSAEFHRDLEMGCYTIRIRIRIVYCPIEGPQGAKSLQ
jgi:hypothetical protein